MQNLSVIGTTTLNRSDYPALYMYSAQAGWDANLLIGSDVVISSAGPFGAVWLRSESSDSSTTNDLFIDSAAVINSFGASADGITATSNNGSVSLINRGEVTVAGGRGLYADGAAASLTPVAVSITNLGTVHAYMAGARAIDYSGTAMIDNQGSVRSTTRQGLIAWSANGGAQIYNSGIVVADHYDAVVAAGTGGDVIVTNSGSITANRNINLAQVSPDFHAISAYTDGNGTVTVSNLAGGYLNAAYDAGMSATSSLGTITMFNAGQIDASTGMLAESNSGQAKLLNEGVINSSNIGIQVNGASGGSIINSGTIASASTAILIADGLPLDVENRMGGLAIGRLQLGTLADLENAGTLVLKQGANLPSYASTGSAVASSIGGDFLQASTGSLHIAVDSAMSYSTLAVGGVASLGGNLILDVDSAYSGGELTSVVTATGGIADNGLGVIDNSLRYRFSTSFRANGLDLVAQDTGMTTIREAVSRHARGAVGAAAIWDHLQDSGTNSAELNQALHEMLQSGSAGDVTEKVQQTLPLLNGDMMSVTYDTLGRVNSAIQSRIDATQDGDDLLRDRQFWVIPFAASSRQNNRDGMIGYSSEVKGVVAGADGELTSDTTLGLAFAYYNTDVSNNAGGPRQNAGSDAYQFVLYGRNELNVDSGLLFQVDAGKVNVEGQRQIDFVGLRATSSYESKTVHAGVGMDHRVQLGSQTTFTPSIRLDYSRIADEAYNESGAGGLDLLVNSRSAEALALGMNGLVSHQLTEKFTATASFGASYDFFHEAATIDAAYAGAPEAVFTTTGASQSAWQLNAGIGIDFSDDNGFGITGRYDAWHRAGIFGQAASLHLHRNF